MTWNQQRFLPDQKSSGFELSSFQSCPSDTEANGSMILNESHRVSGRSLQKFYVMHNNWVALGKEDASRFGEASLFCDGRGGPGLPCI